MKKSIMMIGIIIIVALLGVCGYFVLRDPETETIKNEDALKFAREYKNVSEDNVFVYKNVDEIIKIMEHGTGVVYLGYPECPWCQAYVQYLNEVAKEVGMEQIYYCNTKKVKEENLEKYHQLVSLLSGHLQYNNEGEEWIYVPNVSFHIEGKIIGNDYETSKDTHDLKDPKEYWTDQEIKDLKKTLTEYMNQVYKASNMCTKCNE